MAAENKPIEEAVTEVTEVTENADLLRMEEILSEVTKAKEDIDETKRKASEQLTKALNCVEIVKNVKASIADTEKTIDAKLTALQKTEAKLLSVSKETEKQLSKIEKQTDELKKFIAKVDTSLAKINQAKEKTETNLSNAKNVSAEISKLCSSAKSLENTIDKKIKEIDKAGKEAEKAKNEAATKLEQAKSIENSIAEKSASLKSDYDSMKAELIQIRDENAKKPVLKGVLAEEEPAKVTEESGKAKTDTGGKCFVYFSKGFKSSVKENDGEYELVIDPELPVTAKTESYFCVEGNAVQKFSWRATT